MARPRISRRNVLKGAALSAAAATLPAPPAFGDDRGRTSRHPPNIVFILADDLGWADLSS